ncbi:MAG: DUF899 domain-containing protein [Nocardia sp.]|nr:DUF899 domain-containing protein [Nocardia sp.]
MIDDPTDPGAAALPPAVDRATFQAALDTLRIREKAHTREGDAIAAERRRLPMVEVDGQLPLLGPEGTVSLLDTFEGRRQLLAYYFMWNPGRPAAEQCEGCTFYTSQVTGLSYLHSRDVTFAVLCQGRNVSTPGGDPQACYADSRRYRDFMGWEMPWYSAQPSLESLLAGRELGLFHLVAYVRDGERVFETYWTTRRGVEAMDHSYALMDLTVYGRQESWQDTPDRWPQRCTNVRTATGSPQWQPISAWPQGRPIEQWHRLATGHPEPLTTSTAEHAPAHRCH